MNPALQQLKDIHLPQGISMWPTAPGWIVLYLILFACVLLFIYYRYQQKKRSYTADYALRQLIQLKKLMLHNPNHIHIAAEISTLIRRTALHYFNRKTIAGLSGQNWLQFLNNSGRTTGFNSDVGQVLINAPYSKHDNSDLTPLFLLTEKWLTEIAHVKKQEK